MHDVPGVWTDAERERLGARAQPAPLPESRELRTRRREPRTGGHVWRDGMLVAGGSGALRWCGTGDRRPSLLLEPRDVLGLDSRTEADGPVVAVRTRGGRVLAPERAEDADALQALLRETGGAR